MRCFQKMTLGWLMAGLCFSYTPSILAADSYQLPASGTVNIREDLHDPCAVVTQTGGSDSYFIPAKTNTEWQSFYNRIQPGNSQTPALPASITKSGCPAVCEAGGIYMDSACWYRGSEGESCTTVCASHAGYNAKTLSFGGSGGSNANCNALANKLGGSSVSSTTIASAAGCYFDNAASAWRRGTTSTTTGATGADVERICACNE